MIDTYQLKSLDGQFGECTHAYTHTFSLFTSYPYSCMYDLPPELQNSESRIQKDSKGNLFLSPSKLSSDGVCASMHVCVCACVRMCVFACMNVCMEWSVFIYFLCSEFAESTFRYDRILHCTGFKVQKENTCVIPTMYNNIRPPLMYSLISPSSMNQ